MVHCENIPFYLGGEFESKFPYQIKVVQTIKDFTFVYSNNTYHLKLKQSVIDYLSEFDNMQYIVTIDLDNIYFGSEKIDIVGFTDKPFGSLGIDTINLTTAETREFEVFDNYNIVCPDNLTITIGGAK